MTENHYYTLYYHSYNSVMSEWSGLTLFISSLELCMTVVVRSAVIGTDSSQVFMYQHTVADKHDIPPSHFKLTLGQPALLNAFNGER